MAITKTKFINYIRCPRYVALDKLKKDAINNEISLEEYKIEERNEEILNTVLDGMIDVNGNDLIDVLNSQLEAMLPFYNEVELFVGKACSNKFEGTAKYSKETLNQECFTSLINGKRYMCYVDIYNERDNSFDIIEVKATTSKTFLNIGKGYTDIDGKKKVHSIFENRSGILKLREETGYDFNDELNRDTYMKQKSKLYDKYNKAGHYVYDLAVQRYIIEKQLVEDEEESKIPSIKYYLAVLNSDYIHDGENYTDDIITFIDLTDLTRDYMDKVRLDFDRVDKYIDNMDINKYPIDNYCEYKKTTKCKFCNICFELPDTNSIYAYTDAWRGFKDKQGVKHQLYDLINDGKKSMLDIDEEMLNREKNIIQREALLNNSEYVDTEKIRRGIGEIAYPIYHLDFETFPCPIPRFKGEKPYSQSLFQFSLHIEKEEGKCDKDKDHYEYLSGSHEDKRKEIAEKLCEYIDVSSGCIMVYNKSFEKSRLQELAILYPEYRNKLNKMIDMLFDLMDLIKGNTKFYSLLGFPDNKLFNYYHSDLNGSFSIKKVLPIFTDLSYQNLEVGNGMEAVVTYASYPNLNKLEFEEAYQNLILYCKQDTWAMVEILNGLRKKVGVKS